MDPAHHMNGKVVIITGGAGALGAATGLRCAEVGARVVLTDIRPDALELAADNIRKTGSEVLALQADTRLEEDCERVAKMTVDAFGCINGLFANAGEAWIAPALTQGKKFWDECLALELTGQWLAVKAVLPTMIEQKFGSVVFSSSMTANIGVDQIAAYSAAKGGMQALVKTLTAEFSQHRIRFNTLAIGSTRSRHIVHSNAARRGTTIEEAEREFEEVAKSRDSMFPIGRMGVPDDVAYAARYLLGDESSWVTGTTLVVDGGLSANLSAKGARR